MAWLLRVTELHTLITFLSLFMVIFMLISAFVTRKLFMGPAPVAFIIGIAFGPHAAGLIDPLSWRNVNTVTLEISRVILAVQCFGNAIELPKRYLERHWRSLALIVGPVMVGGWLITACFVKVMLPSFGWRQSLACAACFNAIDPVLASTVLDSGFGKKVPKHLRDLLRTEAAANGIATTVLLNLAANLLQYPHDPKDVTLQTIAVGLAYESLLSAIAGVTIGYIARCILRYADRRCMIDRPSLLAYYLSTAMFSTGFGALVGVDEVNLAFFAGIGLDNDDWYESKTSMSFFASAIDLILNLAYFVFVGSLIPWQSFNSTSLGTVPWRLVTGTICIFLFRRLPTMLLFKPWIPDIKTWREASFYGHFGPIGAGALFSGLTLRGILTPGSRGQVNDQASSISTALFLDQAWAVVTFVVVCSSIVHGTSIAIFSLGKVINTLTITISYTQGNDKSSSWIDRLPRLPEPVAASSASDRSSLDNLDSIDPFPAHDIPKLFLRRQRTDNSHLQDPLSRPGKGQNTLKETSETVVQIPQPKRGPAHAYQFGNTIIVEDEDGNVIKKYTIPSSEKKVRFRGLQSDNLTASGSSTKRMSAKDFIQQLQSLDPQLHVEEQASENSSAQPVLDHAKSAMGQSHAIVERRQELDAAYAVSPADDTESPAEMRRRLGALGIIANESDSDDDNAQDTSVRVRTKGKGREAVASSQESLDSSQNIGNVGETEPVSIQHAREHDAEIVRISWANMGDSDDVHR